MSWSLGEVKALATKAARGAGLPWGMADEASFAVHWLQANGAPGVAALANYLEWRDQSPSKPHELCPIHLGTAIMDADRGVSEWLGRVRQPLLLAPFIARCSPSGMALKWPDVMLVVSETGLTSDASRTLLLTDEAECSAAPATAQSAERLNRVPETEAEAMARLNHFASRTYAPATEASRMSGAGAGITDND